MILLQVFLEVEDSHNYTIMSQILDELLPQNLDDSVLSLDDLVSSLDDLVLSLDGGATIENSWIDDLGNEFVDDLGNVMVFSS